MRCFRLRRGFLAVATALATSCAGQPQLYGIAGRFPSGPINPDYPFGALFRVSADGLNPEFLAAFDSLGNRSPLTITAGLDGCIYGMVSAYDGINGHMLKYDPVTDSLSFVYDFASSPLTWLPPNEAELSNGPAGALLGVGLMGVDLPVYSYRYGPGAFQYEASVPGYSFQGLSYSHRINSAPFLLPNGQLAMAQASSRLNYGAIGMVDTITNTYSTPFTLWLDSLGVDPCGDFVLHNGLLYSTTRGGGIGYAGAPPQDQGNGVIFSYNPLTGSYVRHYAFIDDLTGRKPWRGMVMGSDDRMYGLTSRSVAINGLHYGTLYSFDPNTSAYVKLVDLGQTPLGWATGPGYQVDPLLAASNGKLYGAFARGLFEYDPDADTLRYRSSLFTPSGPLTAYDLIEICRKPNYKHRPTTTFTVCAGSHFTYDLRNTNATSIVWRQNGAVIGSQTGSALEFAAITPADAGVWTCTLSNACGITEPPPITIMVGAGTSVLPAITGPSALCGPDSSVLLTANIPDGTWTGGTVGPALAVSTPGAYQVSLTQPCGIAFSNIINVEAIPLPSAPTITDLYGNVLTTVEVCPESTTTLAGNGPGPWYELPIGTWHGPEGSGIGGSTAPSVTVGIAGQYYITSSNACGTDTSGLVLVAAPPALPPASFTLIDADGLPADGLLCAGDSVQLNLDPPSSAYAVLLNGSTVANGPSAWLHEPGAYQVIGYGPCLGQTSDTASFMIQVDEEPPSFLPIILPDATSPLVGCDQDSLVLHSLHPNAIWSWTQSDGAFVMDTTEQFLVDWSLSGNGIVSLMNYNGCGTGPETSIQVVAIPAPEVLYTEAASISCSTGPAFVLTPGIPPGGMHSGPGVNGGLFHPAAAGIGIHTITYSYSDGTCTGYAQDTIVVELCTGATERAIGSGITLAPNPNGGVFVLTVAHAKQRGSCAIYNELGQQMGHTEHIGTGANSLGGEGLAPGVYVLRIELNGEWFARQIVVARD